MDKNLVHEARQMISYLMLTSARAKLGDVAANTEAMILTMRLNSLDHEEASESIRKQLDMLKGALVS